MTFDDLMRKILKIMPDAQLINEDNDGQIVIYTDLEETPNGQLRKFEPPHDEETTKDVYGEHAWKGASIMDNCSLCGLRYADPIHR